MEVSLLKNKMFPLTFPLLIGAMLQREVCTADMGPAATPLSGLRVDVLNGITQLIGCRPGASLVSLLGSGRGNAEVGTGGSLLYFLLGEERCLQSCHSGLDGGTAKPEVHAAGHQTYAATP